MVALAVVSLIIGAGGLGVAVVALRRDSRTANRIGVLEEARRHDELAPTFSVDCKLEDAQRIVEIFLRGPQDLDDVTFALVFSGAGTVPIAAVRLGRDPHPVTQGSLGPMRIGEAHLLFVALEPNGTRRDQRMVLTARSGDDSWPVTVDFDVPPELSANVW